VQGILLLVCLLLLLLLLLILILILILNGVVVLIVLLPDVLPPLPPAAPIVPVAGPPVVAPHVPGPVDPAVDVNPDIVQHRQTVSRAGSLRYLQTIVKNHIFPRIKFPDPDEDLSFSNDPRSICRRTAMLAGVVDVDIEAWWNLTRKGVIETIK
jgi:hypothetical protein